jgi:nucleoside-diphosphate-sugar epimerase
MRIFLAGASGVIGRLLLPMLLAAGHSVTGITRSAAKTPAIEAAGARAVVVDVFDAAALAAAVAAARPELIIHQLTDLPREADLGKITAAYPRNARLRIEGTRNLVAAARRAAVGRFIAQSNAFAYAPGAEPHRESDPLDLESEGARAISIQGVVALESAVLRTPGIEGVVLRYGRLYGPGTWTDEADGRPAVHVDAAAHAALLAAASEAAGVYNIADEDGAVSIAKAREQLGFDPRFRCS